MSDTKEWETYINCVISSVPTALACIGPSGKILCANKKFAQFFPKVLTLDDFTPLFGNTSEKHNYFSNLEKGTESFSMDVLGNNLVSVSLTFKKAPNFENGSLYFISAKKKFITRNSPLIQQLIDSIPDIIFIKDLEGRFILVNNALAKIFGLEKSDDMIGKSDGDFYPEFLAREHKKDDNRIIDTGKAQLNKQEKIMMKGTTLWYTTTKIPLFDNEGEIQGILGIGKDVSNLVSKGEKLERALKEAEKADKLKSAFLANLSHEIRTPLNGILGFSQFLRNKSYEKSKQDKYLDIIYNNGKQLLLLINDIIDVSMIESNQISITENVFRLNPFLENLKINFQNEVRRHNKDLRIIFQPGLPDKEDYIRTDRYRVQQILGNLLNNAIKFTDDGQIALGYTSLDNHIELFVKDTGIGISKEDQEKIFLRFRQVDESETRTYGGAGLGLSICMGLVERLGGKLWVESKLSHGSTFYFTVPKKEVVISQR